MGISYCKNKTYFLIKKNNTYLYNLGKNTLTLSFIQDFNVTGYIFRRKWNITMYFLNKNYITMFYPFKYFLTALAIGATTTYSHLAYIKIQLAIDEN